jgi:hypothetical protein
MLAHDEAPIPFLEAEEPGATVEQDSMTKDDKQDFTLRIHGYDGSRAPTADQGMITKSCSPIARDHGQKL